MPNKINNKISPKGFEGSILTQNQEAPADVVKKKNVVENEIVLNAKFYHEIILLIVKNAIKSKLTGNGLQIGDKNGMDVFLSTNIVFDSAVFIYESLKYFEKNNKELHIKIIDSLSADDLKKIKDVRNNMHLYNKKGSYQAKATQIIEDRMEEFGFDLDEEFNQFKNDISFLSYLDKDKCMFIGCDYYIHHYTQKYDGNDFSNLAEIVSSTLINIIKLSNKKVSLPSVKFKKFNFNISLNDGKSGEVLKADNIDEKTNFRILLCLTVASWSYLLYFKVINSETMFDNPKSRWVVLKNLAIKYDEIFDSIENLMEYSLEKDKLNDLFKNSKVDFENKKYRELIQIIRNTVHYNNDDLLEDMDYYNSLKIKYGLTISDFKGIFLYIEENLKALICTLQYFTGN
ncbi:hypothetical protein [Acetobacterium woodii]|uniref:Uncharacterized protein n=1 Tax=Acetobacterium woodii (strain ATCC 29683 / DSM 1030 / JCM 2381 / KCTC 1655 / WB1) TaxID=931626 RepID=H6LHW2_ACEWD|nr:hypothetical protein [Acetobacterium woodii]AFA48492.1 hypothetical protein Awo_c17120 [Acetobacterium woodii DSM 1030]